MKKFPQSRRRILTLLLALVGIAVTLAYIVCLGACSALKGDILGIDLKYLGIFYMAVVFLLAWLRKPLLCFLLLAFGAGGEIFLIGYQVKSGVYCPFCLGFGTTVLLACAVNFDRSRKAWAALAAAAGLLFFLLFFSGSTTPLYAAEPVSTAFGRGTVEVRLYTDYFCGPCQDEEKEVISEITELVEKNVIRVVFIDTPIHRETVFYVGYFLAALSAKGDLRQAVAARGALFEAAGKRVDGDKAMEAFLKKKGIEIRPADTAAAFRIFSNYLKEDHIDTTPSCVIIGPQGKQTLIGRDDILKGLRSLRKPDGGK
ncbi:MAG: thioredoxin domain-containing protein [Deltaproteobacteria bacterium]|nr:thioredoxin domain-containing protein [Deltaproteobacteria bacterium]